MQAEKVSIGKKNSYTTWHFYITLSKGRLSLLVAISAFWGYLWVVPAGTPSIFLALTTLFVGGFLVAAAASAWNQYLEISTDAQMKRTANRPLPRRQMRPKQALYFIVFCSILGTGTLWLGNNALTAVLSIAALLLYVGVYTPLKKRGLISVVIGAIPGAMPPLLGCVAAENAISAQGAWLFLLQFVWQFPHFWLIAWLAHEDYSKVGFKLLPTSSPNRKTAWIILVITALLVPIAYLPAQLGMASGEAGFVAIIAGVALTFLSYILVWRPTNVFVLRTMWAGLLYLPLVQLVFVIDAWLVR